MSYVPGAEKLCGLPYDVAECYGKPHIMAFYSGGSVYTHKRERDAVCAICRQRVGSVHHNPPLSKGRMFLLRTKWGQFALKPALFALCGTGTTGCHNGFHGGARYKATWEWDSDEYAEMWWEGELLKEYQPHSRELYQFGCWVIHDARTGKDFRYRGEALGWER